MGDLSLRKAGSEGKKEVKMVRFDFGSCVAVQPRASAPS